MCYKAHYIIVNSVNPVNRTEIEINPEYGILQVLFSMNFEERLAHILAGRKVSPWGRSLGLSNSVIEQLNKGNLPGSDFLQIISRAENINLNFFLNGQGAPYCVQEGTPGCILKWLADRSPATPGFVHLLLCNGQCMLALESYEDILKGKRVIEYKRFDLVHTQLNDQLFDVLKELDDIRAIELPPTVFKQIRNGQMGTYACLGDEQKEGVLKRYPDIPLQNIQLKNQPMSQEATSVIDIQLMRAVLEMVAEVTMDSGEILSEADHAKVTAALYNSTLRDGLTADSLKRGAVLGMLDMLK
jgi:hypothetical protein